MAVCEVCQTEVQDEDVLTLDGATVCAACKPAALAKLQEQGAVADGPFDHLDFKEFKKLRDASESIRALGVLWCLGLLICLVVGVTTLAVSPGLGVLFLGICVLYLFSIIGAFTRKSWARPLGLTLGWLGIIMVVLNIVAAGVSPGGSNPLSIIIQLLISIVTIQSFKRKELFGPDRLDPKEIRAVWKERKKTKT